MTVVVFEQTFTVQAELGLHARPAGHFVSLAGRFDSRVEVARDGEEEWVDGRSILSLLSLAAGRGTVLRVRAQGADAAQAVEQLGRLLEDPAMAEGPAAGGSAA